MLINEKTDRKQRKLKSILALFLCFVLCGCQQKPKHGISSLRSHSVYIDKVYRPGSGPRVTDEVILSEDYPELLWMTGAKLAPKGTEEKAVTQSLLCTATLEFKSPERHALLMGREGTPNPKFFYFGTQLEELNFPSGFAIPIRSNELLLYRTSWQNRSLYQPAVEAEQEMFVAFSRDAGFQDSERPKALEVFSLFATLEDSVEGAEIRSFPSGMKVKETGSEARTIQWQIPKGKGSLESSVDVFLPKRDRIVIRAAAGLVYEGWTKLSLYDHTLGKALIEFTPEMPQLFHSYLEGLELERDHDLRISVSYDEPSVAGKIGLGGIVLYVDKI